MKILRMTIRLLVALVAGFCLPACQSKAADPLPAIAELKSVKGNVDPSIQSAWQTLAAADIDQLTTILAGMKESSPLAENWLRSACDAIVERHLKSGGKLPVDPLRTFVLDSSQSPRARRSAYEWLVEAEPETPDELLPKLLNDPSLEIRYDAVEHVLKQVADAPDNEQKVGLLQVAVTASRHFKQTQGIADQLAKLDQPLDLTKHLGFVTAWHAVGPFDIADGKGFSSVYPPEETVDLSASYQGRDGSVAWTEVQGDGELGQVDFCKTFGKDATGVMYAVAQFNSPAAQPAQVRYETENATKLWLNGKLVAENEIFHSGGDWDQYVAPIQLVEGKNTIMIKVCQTKRTEVWAKLWHFRLRVCDELGGAIHQTDKP